MRVLVLYPAFAPAVNEWAMVWKSLTDAGRVECVALTGGSDRLKAVKGQSRSENYPGMRIRRIEGLLYPGEGRLSEADIDWVVEQQPDVIYCSIQPNIRFARQIARRLDRPILLHTEFWQDDVIVPRRYYLGLPPLRAPVGSLLRSYYRRGVTAIAVSNPKEPTAFDAEPPIHYLAWPHPPQPGTAQPLDITARQADTLAYVGSISRWKGAERLADYLDTLLARSPAHRVELIGPLGDDTARAALARLRRWEAGGRFRYAERLPRAEAIELIGRSLAVVAPHGRMGWGLIGDAWGAGTPVIAVDEHYDIEAGTNALIARTPSEFVSEVQRLGADVELWRRLSAAGWRTHRQKHDVPVVAAQMLDFIERGMARAAARSGARAGVAGAGQ